MAANGVFHHFDAAALKAEQSLIVPALINQGFARAKAPLARGAIIGRLKIAIFAFKLLKI